MGVQTIPAMNQSLLPFKRYAIPSHHIEWLALANAGSYTEKRWWFYPFKTRFLRQHALSDGLDLQIIVKPCWCGDGIWRGSDDYPSLPKHLWETCHKCNGTAIYDTRHIVLIRWLINGRIFHEPSTLIPHLDTNGRTYHEVFNGLIKHPEPPPNVSRRAMERLFLRYEPKTFINLWQRRWSNWKESRLLNINYQFRRVRSLLSKQQPDELPF